MFLLKDFMFFKITFRLIGILLLTSVLECSATLAPAYDRGLLDRTISSNVELMEFFASISSGTCNNSEKFETRKVSYSSLIGKFDALGILSRARPVPKPKLLDKINEELIKKNIPVPKEWDIPSAVAFEKISESLMKMRESDSNKCVTATEIRLFKNQISIFLHQALTYETFLER